MRRSVHRLDSRPERTVGIHWVKLVAAAAALLLPGHSAAQSVKTGVEAWQRGDHEGAVAVWRPLAERGDADAAFNLGQAYRMGKGVPINLQAAQTWLSRAAETGHLDAQATLGLLLFDSGDRTAALRWFRAAADQGEPRASLLYGTALFNGDGVARDPVLAYAYVSRAAAKGLSAAKSTLADMDRLMPLSERKRGLAIAMAKAGVDAPAAAARAARAAKPAPAVKRPSPRRPSLAAGMDRAAWRIQLGAFSQRSSAEALFKTLSARAPVAGKAMTLVPVGKMMRLQVGPFPTRSAAASACASLMRSGQACFPIPGR